MRIIWLAGALTAALLIAVLSLQTPRPAPVHAPATAFSAARAMIDVREIARWPHPVGSAEHARVQAYLLQRMRDLGLEVSTQAGPMSPRAIRHLETMGGDASAADYRAVNLVGVLPGRDPRLPAAALMAHYDTVPMSPGAADDSAGVAALLEAARALKARGPFDRTLVLILTDSEELDLDGARAFFGGHPLRDRIGAIVNLEARGGGGRAMMFETGRGDAETIALFARAGPRATGGATTNSLAAFVYARMPNGTDFTVPKNRGAQGINLAFIGRPQQYHSPLAVPAALDQGSLQHIGSQTLEMATALLKAPELPKATTDAVYADLFGGLILSHPPAAGWVLLLLIAGLAGLAFWRARRRAGLTFADAGRGLLDGVWFLSACMALAPAVRLLGGPVTARADSAAAYYTLLARLPWLEAGAVGVVLAVGLAAVAGRGRLGRWMAAGGVAGLVLIATVAGGVDATMLGAAAVAVGLSLAPGLAARTAWGGWLGLIALAFLFGLVAQAAAPATAFLFLWPAVVAAGAAAFAAFADPALLRPRALAPVAVVAALTGAWLMALAHPVFLGVGMDLPGLLAWLGVLILMVMRPLSPERGAVRGLLIAAAVVLVVGAGLSLTARFAEPMPAAASG